MKKQHKNLTVKLKKIVLVLEADKIAWHEYNDIQ